MGISGSSGAGGGARSRPGGGGGPREVLEEARGLTTGAGPELPGIGCAAGRGRELEGCSDNYDESEKSFIDD